MKTKITSKERVGILTLPFNNNYGGVLQNYSLQVVLKKNGYDVVTLMQDNNIPEIIRIGSILKRLFISILNKKGTVRKWETKQEKEIISENFNNFISKHINTTIYSRSSKQLAKLVEKYKLSTVIVGSDQVWRYAYVKNIKRYYLSFISSNSIIKKVAYSASFGIDTWEYSLEDTERCRKLINDFNAVSVREDTGVLLCEKHFGISPNLTLDPTLLLDRNDYEKLIDVSESANYEDSLFIYLLDKNAKKINFIEKVNEELKLTIVDILPKVREEVKIVDFFKSWDVNEYKFTTIEEWLKAFYNAKYIITDSYHGVIFSIIFNKPFVALINKERGSSRFISLLHSLDLSDRLIEPADIEKVHSVLNNVIDYKSVNEKLSLLKKSSLSFISKNII